MNDAEKNAFVNAAEKNAIARAVSYLGAVQRPDGRWQYWASETQSFWLVTEDHLVSLATYLAGTGSRPFVYSLWCAATKDAEEVVHGGRFLPSVFGRVNQTHGFDR